MAYANFKDLTRRAAANKSLRDKVLYNAKNARYGYQRSLASMVYNLFTLKACYRQRKRNWL